MKSRCESPNLGYCLAVKIEKLSVSERMGILWEQGPFQVVFSELCILPIMLMKLHFYPEIKPLSYSWLDHCRCLTQAGNVKFSVNIEKCLKVRAWSCAEHSSRKGSKSYNPKFAMVVFLPKAQLFNFYLDFMRNQQILPNIPFLFEVSFLWTLILAPLGFFMTAFRTSLTS